MIYNIRYLLLLLLCSSLIASPSLDEPKILKDYEVSYEALEDFDVISLDGYLKVISELNEKVWDYKQERSYTSSKIVSDKYNFDVYIDSYIRTGNKISDDTTQDLLYSEKGISLHVDKLLFDNDYFLDETRDALEKRLANIDKLDNKSRVLLSGVLLYSNLYFSSENLNYFKNIFKMQNKIFEDIKSKLKKSKKTKLEYLTSKDDLLKIKDSLLIEEQTYFALDYALRQSINSHSQKRFILKPFKLNLEINSLVKLQKLIISNSTQIAKSENKLKLKKVKLLSKQRRFIPEIRFLSSVGYSDSIDKKFHIDSNVKTKNWEVGLTMRIPLYYRDEITLDEQKAKYDILIEKQNFIEKQKTILTDGVKLFKKIQIYKQRLELADMQLEILKEKLEIYKNKFLVSLIDYEAYSKILNEYILKLKDIQKLKQKKVLDIVLLKVLLGDIKGLYN